MQASIAYGQLRDDVDALAESLGKGIVLTFQLQSNDGSGNITPWGCQASKIKISPVQALADGDKFNADVQTWATARGYEAIYIQ
jgi:hypothetical protein